MRSVVQRVSEAYVTVDGKETGRIEKGLMALIGVEAGDTEKDAVYLAGKIVKLRIFEDLLGDARGQNRPGFTQAEAPERANELYELCCAEMRKLGVTVENGVFRTHMMVHLVNDGPVTILLDSHKSF